MNLQETIRQELRKEGSIPLPIKRRVRPYQIEEAFDYALNDNALCMTNPNCVLYREDSFWVFSKFVIDDMVTLLEQDYFSDEDRIYFSDNEEDYDNYNEEIRKPLINYFWDEMKKTHEEYLKKRASLKESLESKWNEGDYDYQYGFCHYFAYNIIDKIRERFPNKKVNYYLLLANETDKDTDEVEQEYLLHVYIKIDDMLLDSNGFTTFDKAEERMDDWYDRQLTMTPEDYDINVWTEESDEIPEMFFNNRFCNTGRVKKDMEKFLSNPIVKRILRDK